MITTTNLVLSLTCLILSSVLLSKLKITFNNETIEIDITSNLNKGLK